MQHIRHKRLCLTKFLNTVKRVENTMHSVQSTFDDLCSVWKFGQTLSWVFNASSQSKLKLEKKWRNKIVKIYVISIRWPNTMSLQYLWFHLLKRDELWMSLRSYPPNPQFSSCRKKQHLKTKQEWRGARSLSPSPLHLFPDDHIWLQ